MILVATTDFIGTYSLASSNALDPILQSYIDREEKPMLYKLLGKELADLLISNIQAIKTELTVGPLVIGTSYLISDYVAGDDFINVGATSNASGVYFVATGDTPTDYSNASTLISNRVERYDNILNPFYLENDSNDDWFFGDGCIKFYQSFGIKDILLIQIYYAYLAEEQAQASQSGVVSQAIENGSVLSLRNALRKGETKWNTDGMTSFEAIRWYCKTKNKTIYPEYKGIVPQVRYSGLL